MTNSTDSTHAQGALVPRRQILPAQSPMNERQIIDRGLVPHRGIFDLIELVRRDYRAAAAETQLLDELRARQAAHITARYEAQLELDLGQIVEAVRHELALVQITNQKVEMDWAAELTAEASKVRVGVWVKFGEFMKSQNVIPDEQVDRMVAQFMAMEVAATTTHLATMGGIDGVRRSTEAG